MDKEENTPQFIKQVPWYAQDSNGAGELLKIPTHQPKGYLEDWYNRGQKGFQASSYRKGACQNCGAQGHSKKQCTERPRKVGARFTSRQIASDDVVRSVGNSWQVKRDRWNGFTPEMYKEVIEQFNGYEEVRKQVKGDQVQGESRADDDPEKAASLQTKGFKQKFQGLNTSRNREVPAKYLTSDAEYDPKSRIQKGEDEMFKQLSNLDAVGEKASLEEQDQFAFEHVQKQHMQLNSVALPTLTEKIYQSVKHKRAGLTSGRMGDIMKKYNVDQKGSIPEVEENEYQIVQGYMRSTGVVYSRYEQDILINDHVGVWGSWYNPFLGWGYSCCYSTEKMSYCSGVRGKKKALEKQFKLKAEEAKKLQAVKQMQKQADENEQEEKANEQQPKENDN